MRSERLADPRIRLVFALCLAVLLVAGIALALVLQDTPKAGAGASINPVTGGNPVFDKRGGAETQRYRELRTRHERNQAQDALMGEGSYVDGLVLEPIE
ncbi:MAG: hypothetical protein Alpg2KO_24340 [Alphaproteobacteria bacterium]